MADQLVALEGVGDADDLIVVEITPRRDVAAQKVLGKFDALVVVEPDLSRHDEQFPASADLGGDFDHDDEPTLVSTFLEAFAHRCAEGLDRTFMARGRCRTDMAPLDLDASMMEIAASRNRWWNWDVNDRMSLDDGQKVSKRRIRETALTLCELCPVQWECVAYAIDSDSYFIWAATQKERDQLAAVPDWRERVAEAKTQAVSVRRLVHNITTQEQAS